MQAADREVVCYFVDGWLYADRWTISAH